MIEPVKHDLRTILWCGPAALSAITGEPTSRIVEIIKEYRRSRGQRRNRLRIAGTHDHELIHVAGVLGWKVTQLNLWRRYPIRGKKLSLARFIDHRKWDVINRPVLVGLTHHWIVVYADRMVDSKHKNIISLDELKGRRSRVESARVFHKGDFKGWQPQTASL